MKWVLRLAALALVFTPGLARAVSCTVSATGVAFGVWSPSVMTATGTVTLTFNGVGNVNATIALSPGFSGTYSARTMKNGAYPLTYNLYKDSAHTQIWGDGTGGSTTVTASGFVLFQATATATVYGQIPLQAAPAPGGYTDSITVTVSY
jgi:spore coat protein U-like protein